MADPCAPSRPSLLVGVGGARGVPPAGAAPRSAGKAPRGSGSLLKRPARPSPTMTPAVLKVEKALIVDHVARAANSIKTAAAE